MDGVVRVVSSPGPAHKEFVPLRLAAGEWGDVRLYLHDPKSATEIRATFEGFSPAICEIASLRLNYGFLRRSERLPLHRFRELVSVANGYPLPGGECFRFLAVAGPFVLFLDPVELRSPVAVELRLRVTPIAPGELFDPNLFEPLFGNFEVRSDPSRFAAK